MRSSRHLTPRSDVALALLAVVTGSLTALSLLVGDIVLLWGLSTVRHAVHVPHQPRTA